jgi:signal transduction histidine kinase
MLFDNNKTTEARKYANQGLDLSKKYGIKLMLKEGYALLTEIAEKENNYKEANTYLYDYIAIKDSILNETNSRIIEETEAKYETEKKERDLAETRADLAESELKVRQKNNLIYGSLGLALILGLLGYLFYNQQKLKNRQLQKEAELKEALVKIETQNKLQEQRLRISRDLHDNIGAQLTFIISSIDNLKYGLKEATKTTRDKLSSISDFTSQTIYELRDTIWAMNKEDITFEDLQVRISNFIDKAKVASEKTQFSFSIDSAINPEHSFSSVVGMNIYRIIQEAVNNSLKYADASEIKVSIKKEASHFTITVMDNGKGYDINTVEMGNGLNSMKKRARDIKGAITYSSEIKKGSFVTLKVT